MDPQQQPLQPYAPVTDDGSHGAPPLSPYVPAATDGASNSFPQQSFEPKVPSPTLPLQPSAPVSSNFNTAPSSLLPASPPDFGSTTPQVQTGANPRDDVIARLKSANNVLVTVTSSPSVDQFAAAIGITLILNKLGKHATAVFSGTVPSAIEFLQPEKTIEKNTDSLRDFIIALDKAKADKLRYKVEDKFVKIFITPYRTSLSHEDLEFSQGDFNVDAVLALGVHKREDLDKVIVEHGRILHDATVISVNDDQLADIGMINWCDSGSSSISEMLVGLIEPLQGQKALLDSQVATAFLTGIVAETERFSNNKTTPHTMSTSAILMKAGANQQLVATKLEEPKPAPLEPAVEGAKLDELAKEVLDPVKPVDGSLQVEHQTAEVSKIPSKSLSDIEEEMSKDDNKPKDDLDGIHIDEDGRLQQLAELKAAQVAQPIAPSQKAPDGSSEMIMQPPTLGGALTANTVPESESSSFNPLVIPTDSHVPDYREVQHGKALSPISDQLKTEPETDSIQSLTDIEKSVDSPHANAARQAVSDAVAGMPPKLEPISALNAQPIDLDSKPSTSLVPPVIPTTPKPTTVLDNVINPTVGDNTVESVFPPQLIIPNAGLPPEPTAGSDNPSAPPPVPPPLMPPTA